MVIVRRSYHLQRSAAGLVVEGLPGFPGDGGGSTPAGEGVAGGAVELQHAAEGGEAFFFVDEGVFVEQVAGFIELLRIEGLPPACIQQCLELVHLDGLGQEGREGFGHVAVPGDFSISEKLIGEVLRIAGVAVAGGATVVEVVEEDFALVEEECEGMGLEEVAESVGNVSQERGVVAVFERLNNGGPVALPGTEEVSQVADAGVKGLVESGRACIGKWYGSFTQVFPFAQCLVERPGHRGLADLMKMEQGDGGHAGDLEGKRGLLG